MASPSSFARALRRDVVSVNTSLGLTEGNVMLRDHKRPRPLVLRMGVGDCLKIEFQNLLAPAPQDREQPATREASIHAVGLELVESITDDGTWVGTNPSGLVPPGGSATYTFYAGRQGQHVLHSGGAMVGGEGDGGSTNAGLFGAVNVEPRDALFYRSQVTRRDLRLAARKPTATGPTLADEEVSFTAAGQPALDYDARYPSWHPKAGDYILRMLSDTDEILYSDLTALIVGSDPDGGIGAEILANRFKIGPMHDCTSCKYEEFFLSAWTVGDPAQVVDFPANAPCDEDDVRAEADTENGDAITCTPEPGVKATKVLYPDDPSNVYHSYLRDHVKFRILHAGTKEHHIHHLHAHQWLDSPDGDNSTYLDSQAIGPGSSFTQEIAYHGTGNRNVTVGDSIFHCHFYPHFAQGMWSLWRAHDVFEAGTRLDNEGRPAPGSRALPDGEIAAGTPIPAVIPMPGKPMAPPPASQVAIVNGQITFPNGVQGNPGYPFFVPGIAGERAPHPPLDLAPDLTSTTIAPAYQDGGLPRHLIRRGGHFLEVHTRLDFTKELERVDAFQLDEQGEPEERVAMDFHAQRQHPTCLPNGTCDTGLGGSAGVRFVANGLPPAQGAPYADPCVRIDGTPDPEPFRRFKAADIELDTIFNKDGWHFPQQRMISLWEDAQDTLDGIRPPEPLFFRSNSNDCIEYWLTNLVPNVYELDDFQVRTPTDTLGQHIHLVKFDVTSSDGAANGWNYEDGTFSPDEVRERIDAINAGGGLLNLSGTRENLEPEEHYKFGLGPDRNGDGVPDWLGAQTTVQRWYADDVGTMSVNYRNEPVALRVREPTTNSQADGDPGDLALAFSNHVDRADDDFDTQPHFYELPLNENALPRDPLTPLMEAFRHDPVQVRILVGAHEEGHNFTINGVKWPFEPSEKDPVTGVSSSEELRQWTSATVSPPGEEPFREFVLFTQNDLNLRYGGGQASAVIPPDGGPVENLAETEDPEDSGQKAFNYRTEPVWFRKGYAPETPLTTTRTFQFAKVFTNPQVGGDPETPVFQAKVGDPVRFRLLHPGGTQRNNVFHLHSHVWEQTPYTSGDTTPIDPDQEIGATEIGDNPYSYYEGARMGIGPTCHDDVVLLHGAGGSFGILGDYMYRDFVSFHLDGGLWGLLRVSSQGGTVSP